MEESAFLYLYIFSCRKSADFTIYIESTFAPADLINDVNDTPIISNTLYRSVLKNPISEVLTVGSP